MRTEASRDGWISDILVVAASHVTAFLLTTTRPCNVVTHTRNAIFHGDRKASGEGVECQSFNHCNKILNEQFNTFVQFVNLIYVYKSAIYLVVLRVLPRLAKIHRMLLVHWSQPVHQQANLVLG